MQDEFGQRHFRHVSYAVELTFGEEGGADMDTIKAAGELAVHPNFERERMTLFL